MNEQQDRGDALPRREFLKHSMAAAGALGAGGRAGGEALAQQTPPRRRGRSRARLRRRAARRRHAQPTGQHAFNGPYEGACTDKIAFPMGGIGAGMICLEGTGALSHVSLRHRPDVFNEPQVFAAVCVKGEKNIARVLEGPVPGWKIYGPGGTGNGAAGKTYGLPRYRTCSFRARFPFGTIELTHPDLPLRAEITGWSPFTPGNPDDSSLPVAGLEYRFTNTGSAPVEAVFSFNARNFIATGQGQSVGAATGGLRFHQKAPNDKPWEEGSLVVSTPEPGVKVNHAWFRGGWWDPLTMAWRDVEQGAAAQRPPVTEGEPAPGGSLFVPFQLAPGAEKKIVLQLAWYVGTSNLTAGKPADTQPVSPPAYVPWYASRFKNVDEVAGYWRMNYDRLREETDRFSACFHDTTLPPEVMEAVAANLTILKSPTVLRQSDGRLWAWEGCHDNQGCCHGTCTHVWNYAQAIPHLFPSLERTLRETEFNISQDAQGHQTFRAILPIRPAAHDFHAAADGQLGGIMKVHREWRISGDTGWLERIWPRVRQSLDYCIGAWDPGGKGVLEEPHHNTYDIEFWGPDGMCTSFYLGALAAAVAMGEALKEDVSRYRELYEKGRKHMESELWNSEYFIQLVRWEGLRASDPTKVQTVHGYGSPEAMELLNKEGPKYQYGTGCLSDGVLGAWMAACCGVSEPGGAFAVLDEHKLRSHLASIHRYNLREDLSNHANPQRPSYALDDEGGLLLCSWPKGGKPALPFVYSDEVWTGIEHQAASHMMMLGLVEEGCEVVRTARERYDGQVRNPYNEYECGHWYARAMSSYALIQGLTGVRYDAVTKTLHIRPPIAGDFKAFLSTASGYGTVGVREGKPFLDVKSGEIKVSQIDYQPAGRV